MSLGREPLVLVVVPILARRLESDSRDFSAGGDRWHAGECGRGLRRQRCRAVNDVVRQREGNAVLSYACLPHLRCHRHDHGGPGMQEGR